MDKNKVKWNIQIGQTHIRGRAIDGVNIISERVCFIPDVDIECTPPIKKGVRNGEWVSYRQGNRPTTKEEWESLIGMRLQTMLD